MKQRLHGASLVVVYSTMRHGQCQAAYCCTDLLPRHPRSLLDHRWQPDDIEALWRPRHGLALLHQALDCAADTRLVQTLKLDGLLRVPVCGVGAMAMVS